jgi:isopentenyl-diphosphate delta-isomerase
MKKVTPTGSRKADHIRINLDENVSSGLSTGLDRFQFVHNALPDIDLPEINLGVEFIGKSLHSPILISSMTGGTEEAAQINRTLAIAAQETGVAMGIGSQRAAIENPELAYSFRVREYAPDVVLFANIGAVQLNYGFEISHCHKVVDMIEADALVLHLNPLQEALQPEGDTNFSDLLSKIERVCRSLSVPVIAKEVGWGISGETARSLVDAGIAAIDVAGAGGTSWSQVEMFRAKTPIQKRLAATFINWGIPTADSITQVRQACPETPIIASGGLRTGLDIAKCIALGATIGGMASPFLKAAIDSIDAVTQTILLVSQAIRITMFATGTSRFEDLPSKIVKIYLEK